MIDNVGTVSVGEISTRRVLSVKRLSNSVVTWIALKTSWSTWTPYNSIPSCSAHSISLPDHGPKLPPLPSPHRFRLLDRNIHIPVDHSLTLLWKISEMQSYLMSNLKLWGLIGKGCGATCIILVNGVKGHDGASKLNLRVRLHVLIWGSLKEYITVNL